MNKLKPIINSSTKSYNSLISHLSSNSSHWDVLLLYSSMLKTHIPPDPYTFPSMLKACASLNLVSHGISFHQHIIVNGYSSDAYIGSSLVHMYAKFGCINVAHQLFEVMPERNVVSWTAIIGYYARSGDVNKAFRMYNDMKHDGIKPSSVTILTMLSRVKEDIHVLCLHACAVRYGFVRDLTLVNCMMNLYGKCGRVEDARELFEWMDKRDIVSWNSLVSGYAMVGDIRETWQLLHRMRIEGFEPDQQTFGTLASAASRLDDLRIGKLVHGRLLISGFEMDIQARTSLITMYLKCGNLDDVYKVFEQTSNKDMILWTAMISGLVQNECQDDALTLFQRMLLSGVIPSSTTMASVLAACADLRAFNIGTSIHGYILRQGMVVDVPTQNSLVTMYAKCGHLEQSYAVFYMMDHRDIVSWNAIVSGHAQNGDLTNALNLFNEMRKTLMKPDSVTIVSLLQACASIGAYQQGKWIHNFVIRNSLGPSLVTDTALVDMYFKCGNLDYGKKCFDRMPQHDVVSWSTIIGGYGSHGKGETALEMFTEFIHTGLTPNHVTFLSVLCACSHNGLVDQGISFFNTMTKDFKIEPKLEHCACIVDILCRAGRVEHAYDFYKRMFAEPVADVLGILLDACRTTGNKELGDIIASDMYMLKQMGAANFMQLVNNYAASARWDGVGGAWTQMRSLGLKKIPAWSFIDLHGEISTFFKDHTSHPQHDEILMILKSLSNDIRNLSMYLKPGKWITNSIECGDDMALLEGF